MSCRRVISAPSDLVSSSPERPRQLLPHGGLEGLEVMLERAGRYLHRQQGRALVVDACPLRATVVAALGGHEIDGGDRAAQKVPLLGEDALGLGQDAEKRHEHRRQPEQGRRREPDRVAPAQGLCEARLGQTDHHGRRPGEQVGPLPAGTQRAHGREHHPHRAAERMGGRGRRDAEETGRGARAGDAEKDHGDGHQADHRGGGHVARQQRGAGA